jgi:hypothetical protein
MFQASAFILTYLKSKKESMRNRKLNDEKFSMKKNTVAVFSEQ